MTHHIKWCASTLSAALAFGIGLSVSLGVHAKSTSPVRIQLLPDELPTDRIIVKYKNGNAPLNRLRAQSAAQVAANRQGVRFSVLRQLAGGAHLLQLSRSLSARDAESFANSLRTGDANVEYAEPDRRLMPTAVPNDAMWSQQWSLMDFVGGIRATSAWDLSTGTGITVAVIDTGVRPHADLVENLLPGYDFIKEASIAADGSGRDADPADPGDGTAAGACGAGSAATTSTWHGTHVAGLIAAVTGNANGVAGVAYGAKVLPIRAMGRCGGYTSDVADSIIWAAGGAVAGVPANSTPAQVINLSLGGVGSCDRTSQEAINAARARGTVVVSAAGNENGDVMNASPGNCIGVVTVAATNRHGGKASYSNFGSRVALSAPGGDYDAGIVSTVNSGLIGPVADSYAAYAGTSMAAPMVSGVVALMLSANKSLTPDQVLALLKSTASPFPTACTGCGAGLVDANAAVAAAIAQKPTQTSQASAIQHKQTVAPTGDVEPNDTLASAATISRTPVTISGTLSRGSDNDYFLVSVAPGKSLNITLTPNASLGSALGLYQANGKLLRLLSGFPGQVQRLQMKNPGSSSMSFAVRVLRSGGKAGAYQLALEH